MSDGHSFVKINQTLSLRQKDSPLSQWALLMSNCDYDTGTCFYISLSPQYFWGSSPGDSGGEEDAGLPNHILARKCRERTAFILVLQITFLVVRDLFPIFSNSYFWIFPASASGLQK